MGDWLAKGVEVRIVTARAADERATPVIHAWLVDVAGLPPLAVTDRKDYKMLQLWDDRCVQVIPNTGIPYARNPFGAEEW
jgi:hypothetical protein